LSASSKHEDILRHLKFTLAVGSEPKVYHGDGEDDFEFEIFRHQLEMRLDESIVFCTGVSKQAEMFCLKLAEASVVFFNKPYLDEIANFRRLTTYVFDGDDLYLMAMRLFCRTVGINVLKTGEAEAATAIFSKGLVGPRPKPDLGIPLKEVFRPALDIADEGHVVSRFYGLAHEVGHSAAKAAELSELVEDILPDSLIERYLTKCIQSLPEGSLVAAAAPSLIFGPDRMEICNPDHIREEAAADIFALDTLLETSLIISEKQNKVDWDPARFAAEFIRMTSVVYNMEICRHLAAPLQAKNFGERENLTLALQNIFFFIRRAAVKEYLAILVPTFFNETEPPEDQVFEWVGILDKIDREMFDLITTLGNAQMQVRDIVSHLVIDGIPSALPQNLVEEILEWPQVAFEKPYLPSGMEGAFSAFDPELYNLPDELRGFLELGREIGVQSKLFQHLEELVKN